jgi:hypothetical protein
MTPTEQIRRAFAARWCCPWRQVRVRVERDPAGATLWVMRPGRLPRRAVGVLMLGCGRTARGLLAAKATAASRMDP